MKIEEGLTPQMFRVCPICATAERASQVETEHICSHCNKSWEAPLHTIAEAYYVDASEVQVSLHEKITASIYIISDFPAELGRLSDFKSLQMNRAVSRKHCRIERSEESSDFCVRPFNTPGGTYLNGRELRAEQPYPLNDGDVLNLAGIELQVRLQFHTQKTEIPPQNTVPKRDIQLLLGLSFIEKTENGEWTVTQAAGNAPTALIYHPFSTGSDRILSINRNHTAINGLRFVDHELHGGEHILLGNALYIYNSAKRVLEVADHQESGGINICHITAGYGRERVLADLSAEIPQGKLTAIIGRSGCGKTTLLKILTGNKITDSGSLTASNQSTNETYSKWAENNIALVPQFSTLHGELTVRQCVSYAAEIRLKGPKNLKNKESFCRKILQETDLSEYENKRIEELSGGQLKRVNIAVEAVAQPGVLVLDEPTSGLDFSTEKQIMAVLKQMTMMGRTIIFVTHSLSTVQFADHVIMLHREQKAGTRVVAEGKPEEVLQKLNIGNWGEIFQRIDKNVSASTHHNAQDQDNNNHTFGIPVLIRRYLRIWWNTPWTSAVFFLGLPLLLGVLIRMAVSIDAPFGADRLVFGLVAMYWLGMNQTVREIVKERAIFLQERAHHITTSQYLVSKFSCFVLITAAQAIIMTAPILWLNLSPSSGWLDWNQLTCGYAPVAFQMWVSGLIGCAFGLFGSALSLFIKSKGEVAAVLFAVLATLPQLLFSEKVIPDGLARAGVVTDYYSFTMWHEVAPISEFLSYCTFSRYLYMPLDAVTHLPYNIADIRKAFVFNDGIIVCSILCILIMTWLILELYVSRARR